MSEPFEIHHYVDLSGIHDPRMLAEITRTLEYFATTARGRRLLTHVLKENQGPLLLSDSDETQSSVKKGGNGGKNLVVINAQEIRDWDEFITTPIDAKKVVPVTLPDVLWHELEHVSRQYEHALSWRLISGKKKDAADRLEVHDEDAEAKLRDAAVHENFADLASRSPEQFIHERHRIEHAADAFFDAYKQQRFQATLKNIPFIFDQPLPEYAKALIENSYQKWIDRRRVSDPIYEEPVIARTNKAMDRLYPSHPHRHSHNALFDPFTPNPVNSGTLPPQQQVVEDAKYPDASAASSLGSVPRVTYPVAPSTHNEIAVPVLGKTVHTNPILPSLNGR